MPSDWADVPYSQFLIAAFTRHLSNWIVTTRLGNMAGLLPLGTCRSGTQTESPSGDIPCDSSGC